MLFGKDIVLTVLLFIVYKNEEVLGQSTLAFVIDDTGSMAEEIEQVKKGAKAIFDIVTSYNTTQIEDFVLVTFNDPEITHRTTTKDLAEFRKALDSIVVAGGGDCPEMCMSGVELALKKSRPGSLLYVFTDASAKDYEKFNVVKALAQDKMSQIVFVLTDSCGSETAPDYQVFHNLARATSGQVFTLGSKEEVRKMLKYVEETVKGRQTVIGTYSSSPDQNKFTYNVDALTNELVISVAGKNAGLSIRDPHGKIVAVEDVVRTDSVTVVRIKDAKPGMYMAEVAAAEPSSILVKGTTSLHFEYGFALTQPQSLNDTTTRPLPNQKSYIAVKLMDKENSVTLDLLEIRDLEKNEVTTLPFTVVDRENQFYVTNAIVLPKTAFKIAIRGTDTKTGSDITRISPTSIEQQAEV